MNLAVFFMGLYMLLVAAMGNGYKFVKELETQYDFLPFLAAVIILYLFYQYSPKPVAQPVRALIVLGILGAMLVRYKDVKAISDKIVNFLHSGKE